MSTTTSPAHPIAIHPVLAQVTQRIAARSQSTRAAYLAMLSKTKKPGPYRTGLGCANIAHAFAAMPGQDKLMMAQERPKNFGIITAYNDMLSAHQPYEAYPEIIRAAARAKGATAQVAGGVPAMCDGVTQGEDGMELSLFSRDVIALATAVGLSHNVFDGAMMLGVCDKIVPGLFMGALQFGQLPTVFVPAGPMTSGLSNDDKSKVRQQYAQGLVDRKALLAAEQAAYHSAGTCTFYGTANSNQMLMEIMGLHLPGSSFVNPGTPLRHALTLAAVDRLLALSSAADDDTGMGYQISAEVIVNGIVGLMATGGSTNHTMHLIAMARAAGWLVDWDDFSQISSCTPLLARIYPNGSADVNHFQAAGGMGFLMTQLRGAGLLHDNVQTVMGQGLGAYTQEPWLDNGQLAWRPVPTASLDEAVLRPASNPFSPDGGLRLLQGTLGRSVVKVSAVKSQHQRVRAPAVVVNDQKELAALYQQGKLERDFVAVVRYQGPQANGMPELHKLTPILGILQDKGFKVALVTDGRMSGASGKVPAAIHLSPEALCGGLIGKLQDGDMITLDCAAQTLSVDVTEAELSARAVTVPDLSANQSGTGRDIFGLFRAHSSLAEEGASPLFS
jgi:phosphogluconate dehydratase